MVIKMKQILKDIIEGFMDEDGRPTVDCDGES